MLTGAAPGRGRGRLCLLGAGACHDVDLSTLLESFAEVHLVDIDASAVAEARARVAADSRTRVRMYAPVDLSGLQARLPAWKQQPPTFAEIETNARAATEGIAGRLPAPFDVVASTCVLTQMSFHLSDALGGDHLMLGTIRQTLLVTHLATLLTLTAAGGQALLITDLTSSNSYPLDSLARDDNLRAVMDDIVTRNAFYFAANPTLIRRLLRREDALRGRAAEPELIEPWLWTGAFSRMYLVYGFRLRRP